MINVTFAIKGNDIIGFEVRGHAGYAPIGKDIVCAAVSILAQSTVIGLEKIAKVKGSYEVDAGYLRYTLLDYTANNAIQAQALLQTMQFTVEELASQYEKFINVCTIPIEVI
jgi:uncharacterized protein YsxB (DUF464 family)